MKAVLEFNLPLERFEYLAATYADALHAALCDIARHLRNRLKYGDLPDDAHAEMDDTDRVLREACAGLPEELWPA